MPAKGSRWPSRMKLEKSEESAATVEMINASQEALEDDPGDRPTSKRGLTKATQGGRKTTTIRVGANTAYAIKMLAVNTKVNVSTLADFIATLAIEVITPYTGPMPKYRGAAIPPGVGPNSETITISTGIYEELRAVCEPALLSPTTAFEDLFCSPFVRDVLGKMKLRPVNSYSGIWTAISAAQRAAVGG